MKRFFILVLLCITAVLLLAGCVPEKPAKDGKGELAVTISREFTAPSTHSPLEWWQTHHFQAIDSGDMQEKDCLYCHQTERSCNNCHSYVGVRKIK
jgi:hypothetical protein